MKKEWIIVLILFAVILWHSFFSAPDNFPTGAVINIREGESLNMVTRDLRNEGLIRSSSAFQFSAIIFGGERKVKSGYYLFASSTSATDIAWRVTRGEYGMTEIKVTIPEGFTNQQIGDTLVQKLPHFDEQNFLALASTSQGYLFPDTYFFEPTVSATDIISRMQQNFDQHVGPLALAFATSTRSEGDIITMASILEAEATSTSDQEIIAGILWHRLDSGIALEVDSDRETYKTRGLPIHPIDNPGFAAIAAALNPTATDYLYYLTGNDGVTHYAKTFSEHEQNIKKYLK